MGFNKTKNNNNNNIVISRKSEQNVTTENKDSKTKNKHKSYESIRKIVTEDSNLPKTETKNKTKNNTITKNSISIGI